MTLTCPECKNEVDLTRYPKLARQSVVECDTCGITLQVAEMGENGQVLAVVVDEGK